jgi:chemotaxis receptor (MCP) glutamine deamidase CheD
MLFCLLCIVLNWLDEHIAALRKSIVGSCVTTCAHSPVTPLAGLA